MSQNSAPPVAVSTTSPVVAPGKILELTGYIKAHDPVIARDGDRYYVYTTGSRLPILCSSDLRQWEFCGRVFTENPQWVGDAVPGVNDLWAPDISFYNGKWHLYYSASTFGKNRSVIGLATNSTLNPDSPDYQWVDEGLVVASTPSNDWNAIDPNLALDEQGQPWLAWGSYWSGIKLRQLDMATGKPMADAPLIALASRPRSASLPGALEAAFIVHQGGYFYLFVSFDFCCRGLNSTYKIMVGRAEQISGPYMDREGQAMLAGGGTLVLQGSQRWKGPGHNAVFTEKGPEKTVNWLVYHTYATDRAGDPVLRIEALGWDAEGWPIAPSSLVGE